MAWDKKFQLNDLSNQEVRLAVAIINSPSIIEYTSLMHYYLGVYLLSDIALLCHPLLSLYIAGTLTQWIKIEFDNSSCIVVTLVEQTESKTHSSEALKLSLTFSKVHPWFFDLTKNTSSMPLVAEKWLWLTLIQSEDSTDSSCYM